MKIKGNTILITGGATGIGFALAEAMSKAGNKVIICGRRADKLAAAKTKLPQIGIKVCDVTNLKAREELFSWVKENYPDLNLLINNAGIQKMINLKKGTKELARGGDEIETNLAAPVYLSALFAPWLAKKKEAAIINVSSGLGFIPIAAMPVYCATKAGLHSFTISLRHQLKATGVKVFEIIPPQVDTELGRGTTSEEAEGYRGIPAVEVAKAVMKALSKDEYEIAVGDAKGLVEGAKTNFQPVFDNMNNW
jgi:uncharacterized oxidoreductase